MKTFKLENYKGGWFIGDFHPSLHPTKDFEVSVKYYKAGDSDRLHMHKLATEFTVVVYGTVSMNGEIKTSGDIILIGTEEYTNFISITDSATCVVKFPSVVGDKYDFNIT